MRVKAIVRLWIATAQLHRERPGEPDFPVREIRRRAAELPLPAQNLPSAMTTQRLVANSVPNGGDHRFLYRSGQQRQCRLRLFRHGDDYDPARKHGRVAPTPDEVPEQFRNLLDWYHTEYNPEQRLSAATDPILALRGVGRELWTELGGVKFVEALRADPSDAPRGPGA